MNDFRKKLYDLVEVPHNNAPVNRKYDFVDIFLMILITVNVIAVILETVPEISEAYGLYLNWFEIISVAIFSIEYVVRVIVCVENSKYAKPIIGRLSYMVTPMAIIDLLAILPLFLPMLFITDLRMLRILRVLRFLSVLKFGRYSESLQLIGRVIRAKRSELITTLAVVLLLLTLASSIMYIFEKPAQPEAFRSIPKAMWWGITTLTTVGYGDVYPITLAGRFFAGIIAVLGVGLFALPAGIFASGFAEEVHAKKKSKQKQKCPHCGEEIEN